MESQQSKFEAYDLIRAGEKLKNHMRLPVTKENFNGWFAEGRKLLYPDWLAPQNNTLGGSGPGVRAIADALARASADLDLLGNSIKDALEDNSLQSWKGKAGQLAREKISAEAKRFMDEAGRLPKLVERLRTLSEQMINQQRRHKDLQLRLNNLGKDYTYQTMVRDIFSEGADLLIEIAHNEIDAGAYLLEFIGDRPLRLDELVPGPEYKGSR